MKKILILIFFVSMLLIVSCSSEQTNIFNFSTDAFLQGYEYTINVNKDNDSLKYVQIEFYSNDSTNWKSNITYKLDNKKSVWSGKFKIPANAYYMSISCYSDNNYIHNNGYNFKTEIMKLNGVDTIYSEYAFITMKNAMTIDYMRQAFELDRKFYNNNLYRYLYKWQVLGENKKGSRQELADEVNFISEQFINSTNYDIVCAIGYKLLQDTSYKRHLKNMTLQSTQGLNIPKITQTFNKVFASEMSNKKRKMNDTFKKIMLKNPKSYYTITMLDWVRFSYKNDIDFLNLIEIQILNNNLYYYKLLSEKLLFYTINHHPNYFELGKQIEQEFNYAYNNQQKLFQEGLNSGMAMLEYKNIYYENLSEFYSSMGDKQSAIAIKKQSIKEYYGKDKLQVLFDNLDIGKFYSDLNLDDSTELYYFKAYHLKKSSKYVAKHLQKFYKRQKIKKNFDEWVNTTYQKYKKQYKVQSQKQMVVDINYISLNDKSEINIKNTYKPTVLMFISLHCQACQYIVQDMNNNPETKNYLMNKVNFAIVSPNSIDELKNIINPIYIKNYCRDDYHTVSNILRVTGYPVVIVLDKSGNIIDRIEGANKDWKLLEFVN